jgi:hypothetical protein
VIVQGRYKELHCDDAALALTKGDSNPMRTD